MRDVLPVHPEEMLREEFLKRLNLSVYARAKALGVPAPRVFSAFPLQGAKQ